MVIMNTIKDLHYAALPFVNFKEKHPSLLDMNNDILDAQKIGLFLNDISIYGAKYAVHYIKINKKNKFTSKVIQVINK